MNLSRKYKTIFIIAIGLLMLQACNSKQVVVNSDKSLQDALTKHQSGVPIIVKDGTYHNFHAQINQSGTEASPLIIKAETPGKVFFTGASTFEINGSYVVFKDFYFKAPLPQNGMDGGKPVINITGDYNRVTNCAFLGCHNRASIASLFQEKEDRMPKYTRIDHCYFADNFGWRLYLDLGKVVPNDDLKYAMNYRIDHNYFSTPFKFGANTGSSMRIGLGPLGYGHCLVDNNLFERQNGEVELIENKSHENVYLFNTFKNCESQMSFRQGKRTIFLKNTFIGTDKNQKCGGLGMWMNDHVVAGNYFSFPYGSYIPFDKKMKPRTDRFPAAVVRFMAGCTNFIEDNKPVGHFAANKISFANNIFYNNSDILLDLSHNYEGMYTRYKEDLGIEVSGSSNHKFDNNIFFSVTRNIKDAFYDIQQKTVANSTWNNNMLSGYQSVEAIANNSFGKIQISSVNGLKIPFSEELIKNKVEIKIDKVTEVEKWLSKIPGVKSVVDLEQIANTFPSETQSNDNNLSGGLRSLSFQDVGPIWLTENPSTFAKDGIMTDKLKTEILNNIQK